MLESYPKASPPASGSTFVPLFLQLHWAGQGTRLPSARLQHKARPGEGKSHSRVHSRGSCPRAAAVPSAGSRPSPGSTTSAAQKLGSCGSLAFRGQLPGTSYQLGPARLGQPTDSRGPRLRPPARPSPPRSPGWGSLANTPACSSADTAAPKLASARGARSRGSASLV